MSPVIAASTASDASVWSDLLSVVVYGLIAGVGITVLFSIADNVDRPSAIDCGGEGSVFRRTRQTAHNARAH